MSKGCGELIPPLASCHSRELALATALGREGPAPPWAVQKSWPWLGRAVQVSWPHHSSAVGGIGAGMVPLTTYGSQKTWPQGRENRRAGPATHQLQHSGEWTLNLD